MNARWFIAVGLGLASCVSVLGVFFAATGGDSISSIGTVWTNSQIAGHAQGLFNFGWAGAETDCCDAVLCDLRDSTDCNPTFAEYFSGWTGCVPDKSSLSPNRSQIHRFLRSGGRNESTPALQAALQQYFSFRYRNHPMFRDRKLKASRASGHPEERRRPNSRAVQELLVRQFVSPGKSRPRPSLYLIGGGGGAGKSTLVTQLHAAGLLPSSGPAPGVVYVNHDIVMERDRRYLRLVRQQHYGAARLTHPDAAAVGDLVCQAALAMRSDLVLEGTLSQPDNLLRLVEQARAHNYSVRLFGLTVPADQAIQRVLRRAASTARFVPPPLLLHHHLMFATHWPRYMAVADSAQLYQSAVNPAQLVLDLADHDRRSSQKLDDVVLDWEQYKRFAANQLINDQADFIHQIYGWLPSEQAVASHIRQNLTDWWWWPSRTATSGRRIGRGKQEEPFFYVNKLHKEAVQSVCSPDRQ